MLMNMVYVMFAKDRQHEKHAELEERLMAALAANDSAAADVIRRELERCRCDHCWRSREEAA